MSCLFCVQYKCISTYTFIIKGSSDAGDTSGIVTISSTTSRSSKGKRFPVKVLTQWKEGMEVTHTDTQRCMLTLSHTKTCMYALHNEYTCV